MVQAVAGSSPVAHPEEDPTNASFSSSRVSASLAPWYQFGTNFFRGGRAETRKVTKALNLARDLPDPSECRRYAQLVRAAGRSGPGGQCICCHGVVTGNGIERSFGWVDPQSLVWVWATRYERLAYEAAQCALDKQGFAGELRRRTGLPTGGRPLVAGVPWMNLAAAYLMATRAVSLETPSAVSALMPATSGMPPM